MAATAKERMQIYRQRKKAAGYKALKLWADPELQQKIQQLRRKGENLETLLRRALDAAENQPRLEGKILLLQTEYILPLREEMAKLKNRLKTASAPQSVPVYPNAAKNIAHLQAQNAQLQKLAALLKKEVVKLRAHALATEKAEKTDAAPVQETAVLHTQTIDLSPPVVETSAYSLKNRAKAWYLAGMRPAEIWARLAAEGTPPGSRSNFLRYLQPSFAERVLNAAAAIPPAKRFDKGVFISDVWEFFQARAWHKNPGFDYAEFKRRLLAAQQAKQLRLKTVPAGFFAPAAVSFIPSPQGGEGWHLIDLG